MFRSLAIVGLLTGCPAKPDGVSAADFAALVKGLGCEGKTADALETCVADAVSANQADVLVAAVLADPAFEVALDEAVGRYVETNLPDVERLEAYLSVDPVLKDVVFAGVNVQVRNAGTSASTAFIDGTGNLIVGWNEPGENGADRGGSHNLVVGPGHAYAGSGGVVFGADNRILGEGNVVVGGRLNLADGIRSVVVGGREGESVNGDGVVVGGYQNRNEGSLSVVLGGASNRGAGDYNVLVGGANNDFEDPVNSSYGVVVGGNNERGCAGNYELQMPADCAP